MKKLFELLLSLFTNQENTFNNIWILKEILNNLFKKYTTTQITFNHQTISTSNAPINKTLAIHPIKPLLHSLTLLLSSMYQIMNSKEIP